MGVTAHQTRLSASSGHDLQPIHWEKGQEGARAPWTGVVENWGRIYEAMEVRRRGSSGVQGESIVNLLNLE